MILALDLSLSCVGYSIFNDDGKFIKIGHIETNEEESTPLRLNTIAKQLRRLKKEYKPSIVLIEQGFFRHIKSTQQVFRTHGIANLIFCGSEQIELHATHIRKVVTNVGNCTKEEMKKYLNEKYPNIKFENYDEVDSFALAQCYFIEREKTNESGNV